MVHISLFLFFDICRNFRQFNGHCGWYILEALDSVICLTSSIYFTLNLVAVSLKASGRSLVYMCIPGAKYSQETPHTHRLLPPYTP